MFRHQKLIAVCWAVLFAFALAGCSSSSDNQTSEPTEPTEPTGPTPAEMELAELRAELAALRDLLGIEDDDDVGDSIADLQSEIADLKAQVQAAEDEAAAAAAKARQAELNALATAIADDAKSGALNRLRADNARSKGDDAEDLDDPAAISGWSGESYSDENTVAVVYTNQGSPVSAPFNQKWGTADAANAADRDGVYTLTAATHGELVDLPGLPAHASHPGVRVGPVGGVRGTFDGVPGTFKGVAGTNTNPGTEVKVDGDGNATWNSTDLTFTPDSNTASVTVRDSSYLNLGYWLTTATDGSITPEVAAWGSSGLEAYDGSAGAKNFIGLIGKAAFDGIAVGQYTIKNIDSTEGGAFNADAALEVDFGADNALGTITGTIDGFMSNGEALGSGWKVLLAANSDPFNAETGAPIVEGSDALAGLFIAIGGAEGTFGTRKVTGDWGAGFLDGSRNDDMPGALTAHFRVEDGGNLVNMIGALAAINQEADQPDN